MEEAKTLLHHALTAMFAVLILGAVMSLITLGYMMWSAFSKQDATNQRLKDYAKFSAFDNTEIRGQEVIALLHNTQGSPWVMVIEEKKVATTGPYTYTPVNIIFTIADSSITFNDSVINAQFSDIVQKRLKADDIKNKSILSLASTLSGTAADSIDGSTPLYKHLEPLHKKKTAMNFTSDASRPSYSEIQQWFLDRGALASGGSVGGYLPYTSYLVYEDSNSTDIMGIMVIEHTSAEGGTP